MGMTLHKTEVSILTADPIEEELGSFLKMTGYPFIGYFNCRLVSLVGKVAVHLAGGLGLIPCWTNTQGLKIIEEKVLPLL